MYSLNVTGNVAKLDITDLTEVDAISYGIKLELAAVGFVVVKYFYYIVENHCSTASNEDFTANSVSNRALDIAVYNLLGKEELRAENVQF
tara:strand:+ start:215 stop:484 length:270 start_codon:yes stop_codon:yes gene_type:complete